MRHRLFMFASHVQTVVWVVSGVVGLFVAASTDFEWPVQVALGVLVFLAVLTIGANVASRLPVLTATQKHEREVLRSLRIVRSELFFFLRQVGPAIESGFYWPERLLRQHEKELRRLAEEPELGEAHDLAESAYYEWYRIQNLADARRPRKLFIFHRRPPRVKSSDQLDGVHSTLEEAITALDEATAKRKGTYERL